MLIKVSTVFAGPCQNVVDNSMQLDCENETYSGMLQTNFEGMAVVGLDAMQRANSTLEDFVSTFFITLQAKVVVYIQLQILSCYVLMLLN